MFLTEEDYRIVADERTIDTIQQFEESIRLRAEKTAIEEVSTYLRGKYDVAAIFEATGDDRNHLIVTLTCDVNLYHLASWLPGKMGLEIRIERYDRAIAQLRDIAKGNTTPDLPLLTDDNGQSTGGSISFGSDDANQYDW
jgi:phage gp36-like protein